jgi:copper chaperone CopZ
MSGIIIPSSPEDRKRIKSCMEEVSNALTRIDGEKDYIKEAINSLSEEVDVPKKVLNKMARVFHKQNLPEVVGDVEDVEALYESVMSIK